MSVWLEVLSLVLSKHTIWNKKHPQLYGKVINNEQKQLKTLSFIFGLIKHFNIHHLI